MNKKLISTRLCHLFHSGVGHLYSLLQCRHFHVNGHVCISIFYRSCNSYRTSTQSSGISLKRKVLLSGKCRHTFPFLHFTLINNNISKLQNLLIDEQFKLLQFNLHFRIADLR